MPSEENKKYGYIKKYRSVLYSKFWAETSPEQYRIADFILYSVRFKREEIELKNEKKIILEPGQLLTTVSFIQSGVDPKGKWATEKTVKYALDKLQKLGFLSKKNIKSVPKFWCENDKKGALLNQKRGSTKDKKGIYLNKSRVVQCTLITIENWGFYQNDFEKGALLNQNEGFTYDEMGTYFEEKGAITKECIYKNDIYNMSDSKESDAPPGAFKDSINTNKKTKSNKKKTTKVFEENSIEYQLSEKFYRKVSEFNSSKYDEKPDLQKWSSEFEKLMRLDKVKSEDIETLIDWIFQEGNFWNDKVQTPAKFRKRDKEEVKYFNKIFKQMEKDPNYYRPSQKDLEKELPPITAEEFYDI